MIKILTELWESFKEYIILIVLLITSLVTLSLNQRSEIKKVKAVAFGSFAAVTSVVSDVIDISKVKSENDRLRRVNAELMLQVNRLREYGIVNTELKNMLSLKDTSSFPLIPAKIVSKALTIAQSTITINAGSNMGIRTGMPVVNDQGLIGIISTTSEDFSIAKTLRNRDLKLTVKDERSRVDGVMKWNGEDLVMVNVPKTYDIEAGDRVIVSDLSSVISIPLPIGIVTGLNNVETGIFNEVKIKPYVDFVKTEYVFVLGVVASKQKNNLELNFYNK